MKILWFLFGSLMLSPALGQTLPELLKQAEANYPLLKARAFETQASESNVSYTKSSALPSLDAGYQVNYATYNNLTGMAAPLSLVPMTGPPSTDNISSGVFGSAATLLLNWEPFTFGQRRSRVDLAKAYLIYNQANAEQETFKHKVTVTNAYLDVVLAHELLKVYSKNLGRAIENVRIVRTLFRSGLRPAVDTALFNAELSRAKIELLNYQKYLITQQATLAELLGTAEVSYSVDSSFFKILPPLVIDSSLSNHPHIILSASRVAVQQQQRSTFQHTLYPTLGVWGTTYARGSGIRYDGYVNATDGLSFSRYNYGAGVQLRVPLLRFLDVRHQLHGQDALIHAQEQQLSLVKLQLDKENKIANATLSNAREVAAESPVLYQSAEFSYHALLTRYNSGLTNYADLIQSQYGLVKAESDLKKSYLEAWKALLYKAAVQGDLNLFLNHVK